MRQVWKLQLTMEVGEAQSSVHDLPQGFKVLTVAAQYGWVTVWIEVNPTAEKVPVTFWVVGTGRNIPENTSYMGTAILYEGQLVAHVYR